MKPWISSRFSVPPAPGRVSWPPLPKIRWSNLSPTDSVSVFVSLFGHMENVPDGAHSRSGSRRHSVGTRGSLSARSRLRAAVGDQRADILDAQAGIGLIERNRGAARARGEVDEFLKMSPARRRRRILGEFEYEVEHAADIFREIGDVFVEGAIVDREEADLIVLQRHELRKMRRADGIEIVGGSTASRAQQQLDFDEGEARSCGQDDKERAQLASAADACCGCERLDLLDRYIGIGGVDVQRMDEAPRRPFDECIRIVGDWGRRRTVDMLKDRVENRSRGFGEVAHQRAELAVEIAEEQQRALAQHRESRIVDRADRIGGLEQDLFYRRNLIRESLGVRRLFQRESKGEMRLAHAALLIVSNGRYRAAVRQWSHVSGASRPFRGLSKAFWLKASQ